MQSSYQPIMRQCNSGASGIRHIRIGNQCGIYDFLYRAMIVGGIWIFQDLPISWDFPTQHSLEFTQHDEKAKTKNSARQGKVRADWKATGTRISTLRHHAEPIKHLRMDNMPNVEVDELQKQKTRWDSELISGSGSSNSTDKDGKRLGNVFTCHLLIRSDSNTRTRTNMCHYT